MADVILEITIPDQHVDRVKETFEAYDGAETMIKVGNDIFAFQIASQGTDNMRDFAKNLIKGLVVALVKCKEYHTDRERYQNEIKAITPPAEEVPEDIVT